MSGIFFCKICKFSDKNCYNYRYNECFLRDCLLAKPFRVFCGFYYYKVTNIWFIQINDQVFKVQTTHFAGLSLKRLFLAILNGMG